MSAHRSHRARASKRASRSPRLLRCEQLESRTVLAAISPVGSLYLLVYSPVGDIGVYGKTAASTVHPDQSQHSRRSSRCCRDSGCTLPFEPQSSKLKFATSIRSNCGAV